MIEKEILFLRALIEKIQQNIDVAFFSKGILENSLFSWNDIEHLINDFYRLTPELIELIDASQTKIKIPTFTNSWSKVDRPDPKFIIEKINSGSTFVLLGASRFSLDINEVCRMIERIIPETSVDTHVYGGLKKSKSFKAHFDHAHNIIINQSGKCHWKVYKQRANDCNFKLNVEGKKLDVEFEFEAEEGDLLYVPMYQYHECFPLSKRISLSFPIVQSAKKISREWFKIKR